MAILSATPAPSRSDASLGRDGNASESPNACPSGVSSTVYSLIQQHAPKRGEQISSAFESASRLIGQDAARQRASHHHRADREPDDGTDNTRVRAFGGPCLADPAQQD